MTVRSGIVTITGQVESRALAPHLIDAIRHAEGVVDLRARISFPPADQPKGAVFLRSRPPG